MLSRDQIFAADDLPREKLAVPEWGGDVYVKTFTAGERDYFETYYTEHKGKDIRATLAALTVCDENGVNLFSLADVPALSKKSASALNKVFEVALRLNAITGKDVEDLEKK